ncbi:carbohydrate ABC transporter permease [Arthrobacter sp. EH-1B-1]|uniref:Carbohydrate ABC transporter permease n=2 Tax=Arthrobacter vasquezii TaxID=2977629 RepID=A0ABT6CV20_9MICC|nr:carbohydrate ABC transporter permease [Arthrobacter vasquezii]
MKPTTPNTRPRGAAQAKRRPDYLSIVARYLVRILLVVMSIGVLYPLFWMFSSAFKTSAEIFADPWALPNTLSFENYVKAWNQGVVAYFANSVIITVISLAITLLLGAAAAYALTKLNLPFSKTVTFLILGGLMVSPTMILVPLFQLLQTVGLYNTHAGLIIVYVAYRLPFTIFLIRAYMLTLSDEVVEAARIDGANSLQIFLRVIIPLCKPVLASAGLVYVLFAWNEFPFALVFLNDTDLKTLPVGLLDFRSTLQTDWSVLFAGLGIASLPMIIAFAIGQRYFIRGLSEGMGK